MLYLRLEKTGEHWQAIAKEKQLVISLGSLYEGVQLMLWAVPGLDSRGAV
jgi:predicted component of type VI protein secretion system